MVSPTEITLSLAMISVSLAVLRMSKNGKYSDVVKRTECHKAQKEVKTEIKTNIGEIKTEIKKEIGCLRGDIGNVHKRVDDVYTIVAGKND